MKTLKRLLTLCLVVLMCFGSLVACGGGDETTTTTTTTGTGGTSSSTTSSSQVGGGDTSSSTVTNPFEDPLIPWDKFNDMTCTFYYKSNWGQTTLWIKAEDVGTNQADIATASRLDFFREKTGITMHGITTSAMNNYEALKTLIDANDPSNVPDILFLSPGDAMAFTFNNDLVCLNDPATPNMNFDRDCWHKNLNDNLAIWGHYYTVSGYYDTSNFERSAAMFFDRDALATINPATIDFSTYPELAGYTGEDSLYQWVKDGEWTWDKAVALAKLFAGVDGSYNGSVPAKNGIEYHSTDGGWLMASVDLKPFQEDEFGVPTLNLTGEAQEKLAYLHENIMYDGGSKYANWTGNPWGTGSDDNHPTLFGVNHTALFHVNLVNKMVTYAGYSTETVAFRYGILPLPKYNEQQEGYYCNASAWYTTLACIPKACTSIDFSTFVLQHFTEMGRTKYHQNVKTIYEAVVEDGLSGRYAATTDNADSDKEMLQIIMDSVDAWFWDYASSQLGGAQGKGDLLLELNTKATPNYQSFNDTNAPLVRNAMYALLIKLGLAEEV